MRGPFEDPVAWAPGVEKTVDDGPDLRLTRFPAPHRWASRGRLEKLAFGEVLAAANEPELWPGAETVLAGSHRLPAWSFARFRDESRVVARDADLARRETRERVEDVAGLVVEYVDEPAVDGAHLLQWWGDYGFLATTTGFHELPMADRPEGPRWRVFLPFTEPVDTETAEEVAAWVRHPRHDVGIVDASTAEVFRLVPAPAIGPGGYRWLARGGPALDPRQALRELAGWRSLDVRARAERDLEGTSFAEGASLFLARRRTPRRRPVYPGPGLPALEALLGPLRPGRRVAVVGSAGSGRTAMALQLVLPSVWAGLPVLFVLTRSGPEDVIARMLAAESGVPVPTLLQGGGAGVDETLESLLARAPGLHLWAPTARDRTLEALERKVRAVHDVHRDIPPLVVVDGVEAWAVDDPDRGGRTLVAGLRDLARSGTTPGWPGAAVVFVSELAGPARSPDQLQAAWEGERLERGPYAADAHAVLVTALKRGRARVVVAKNDQGHKGVVDLGFDAVRQRFIEGADEPSSH